MTMLTWLVTMILIIGAAIIAGTKLKSSDDWSIAEKSLGPVALGSVLAAWKMGGVSTIGVAQNGYNLGIAGAWYTIMCGGFYVMYIFIAPLIRKNVPADSIPSYLRTRYSPRVGKLYSIVQLIYGFLYIPFQTFALSTVIQLAVPGVGYKGALIIGLLLAAVYTGISGMRGAEIVGKATCVITYCAIAVTVYVMLNKVGGLSVMRKSLPTSYFSMIGPIPSSRLFAWFMTTLLSSCTVQAGLQPILAARDDKTARFGSFIGLLIILPLGFFCALIGMSGKMQLDIADTSTAFAVSVRHFVNPMLAGFAFAAVTLIIVTTLSTMILGNGTLLKNIYATMVRPHATEKELLKFSRVGTIAFSVLSLIPALLLERGDVTSMYYIITSCASGPMIFAVFGGLFWYRANDNAAFISILTSSVLGVVWVACGVDKNTGINVMYPVLIVNLLVGIVITLLSTNKCHFSAKRES